MTPLWINYGSADLCQSLSITNLLVFRTELASLDNSKDEQFYLQPINISDQHKVNEPHTLVIAHFHS